MTETKTLSFAESLREVALAAEARLQMEAQTVAIELMDRLAQQAKECAKSWACRGKTSAEYSIERPEVFEHRVSSQQIIDGIVLRLQGEGLKVTATTGKVMFGDRVKLYLKMEW